MARGIGVTAALRPETHHVLSGAQLRLVQVSLGQSLRDVFLEMLVIAGLAILCSIGLRGGRALSYGEKEEALAHEDEDLALAVAEHG